MTTGSSICDIVIPGYTLTERIGAGGYAEVWRAEAPGGIAKAVKIVYGYCEDEFASQELKALERVKGVRHPFLLSLERFEVISGRLAILTELADMSLEQRVRLCRTEGLPGIPRDELLRYLADAAEALDFLAQRHNLLHLDIKPENLLVLGDHVKVADFGLVKELATRTQNSLVSGMTPTYASPEMFDDDPSVFSDQYSLAIVYQEMLTGSLPFPGRTAAQLAKQHTQSEPQLMALATADRGPVARALSKKPSDRFPTCRSFVEALSNSGKSSFAVAPPAAPAAVRSDPVSPSSVVDTKPTSSRATIPRKSDQPSSLPRDNVTRPVQRPSEPVQNRVPAAAGEPLPKEEIVDVPAPHVAAIRGDRTPTLYIAIGGLGANVLCRMRSLISKPQDARQFQQCSEMVAIDTNRDDLRDACSSRWESPLVSENTLHLPLKLPKCYDDARAILDWVSRRWLYNIPRSLETRGFRPLGRVALVDHARQLIGLLERAIKCLQERTIAESTQATTESAGVRIVVLASTGGGTGSGTVIDVANAARAVAAEAGLRADVHALLLCTCFANSSSSPLLAANTLSLLTELNHAAACGNKGMGNPHLSQSAFESTEPPFDHVYWAPVRPRSNDGPIQDSLDVVAQYLAAETRLAVGSVLSACRQSKTPHEANNSRQLQLRKFGVAEFELVKGRCINELATELAEEVTHYWLSLDKSRNWAQLMSDAELATTNANGAAHAAASAMAPETASAAADASLLLRQRFQAHGSRMFVTELLQQIQLRLGARDERGRHVLGATDASLIADVAYRAIGLLATADERRMHTAQRFSASPLLRPLIAAASERLLSGKIATFDRRQPDRLWAGGCLTDGLTQACGDVLRKALSNNNLARAITTLIDRQQAVEELLAAATTDLVQCGYDRRTLIFVPETGGDDVELAAFQSARPLAGVRTAEVADVLVISEDTGIAPHSLAARLQDIFPGIAEAATRLHTRTDIEWTTLVS